MNFKKDCKQLILLILFLISTSANANFMLEIGGKSYNAKFKRNGNSGEVKGFTQTLQAGYINKWFSAGVLAEVGKFQFDSSPFEIQSSKYYRGGGLGTFLGVHFLDRLRLYTYYLNTNLTSTNNDDYEFFGQMAAVGISYRIWGGILINYEYFNNYMTQVEDNINGPTHGLDPITKINGYVISLSMLGIFR